MMDSKENEISLRPFRPSDKLDCLGVFDSNVGKYFAIEEKNAFESFLNDLPGPYFVLIHADKVIGCGGYAPDQNVPQTAVFCWGMVHRLHHKLGFGRTLAVERIAKIEADASYNSVRLRTSQHACGFYEKMGFHTVELNKNAISDGIDECLMHKNLRDA